MDEYRTTRSPRRSRPRDGPGLNDGHYICLSDMAYEIGLASTLRMYQNNDVLDGFVRPVRGAAQYPASGGCV
jgi:hypothetical protein